jgi:23S rRNA pseudouridine955/2504/2580 synthase
MIRITITENQGNQRLDRFLKKYFPKASLSYIYKLIRKDVKINGKRKSQDTVILPGDELAIYISEEAAIEMQKDIKKVKAKKQFTVIYQDENILIVDKPFGLLTHGDKNEKKNHLANQVIDYLISEGEYDPRIDYTFVPSPANRLDRNTTGLVIFGKNASALRELNKVIRERDGVEKVYRTITVGQIKEPLHLLDNMIKDQKKNISLVTDSQQGKLMDTEVTPLEYSEKGKGYTFAEVKINTGRTHQIRLQLASIGHALMGDTKYGKPSDNKVVKEKYGLTTQLLHACRLTFTKLDQESTIGYLQGQTFTCPLPQGFLRIKKDIFG